MPTLRPISPSMASSLLKLDLDVDPGRNVQLLQGLHRLSGRARDVDQALVDPDLELLARLLVHVRRPEHGVDALLGRQRHRSRRERTRAPRGADDLARRLVEQRVVVRLEANPNPLHGRYSAISATTPAPTVRPPSRMANRSSFSIAIGVIISIDIVTLSPGITISRPSGRCATPVTSVVRK